MEKPYTYFADIAQTVETIRTDNKALVSKDLAYKFIAQAAEALQEIPPDSIVSRTIPREGGMKAIVFAFAPGQELSEHTASVPAVIQILQGEADLTVGGDHYDARPGTWVRMDANLSHSIYAHTPVIMLLIMLDRKE